MRKEINDRTFQQVILPQCSLAVPLSLSLPTESVDTRSSLSLPTESVDTRSLYNASQGVFVVYFLSKCGHNQQSALIYVLIKCR